MTSIIHYRTRRAAPARPAAEVHLYAIGQSVRFANAFRGAADAGAKIYEITGTLPARNDGLQYRIRGRDEVHERVTTQAALEPVAAASASAMSLMEATFAPRIAPRP